MRYAKIENGVVTNVAIFDDPPHGWVTCPRNVGKRFTLSGDVWTPPTRPEEPEELPESFDEKYARDPLFQILVDELEEIRPGFRDRARVTQPRPRGIPLNPKPRA